MLHCNQEASTGWTRNSCVGSMAKRYRPFPGRRAFGAYVDDRRPPTVRIYHRSRSGCKGGPPHGWPIPTTPPSVSDGGHRGPGAASRRLTLASLAATLPVGGAAAFGEERDRMELRTA